jgi:hypothetical protein
LGGRHGQLDHVVGAELRADAAPEEGDLGNELAPAVGLLDDDTLRPPEWPAHDPDGRPRDEAIVRM